MKKLLSLIVVFYSCTSNPSKDLCEQIRRLHFVYPEFGISIKIPNEWLAPDSSSIGHSKYLKRVMTISSKDSSENLYYDINDFPEKLEGFDDDSVTMKRFVSDDTYDLFSPDSILSADFFDSKGWQTVVQIAVKKEKKFSFLGHIFSVRDTKKIYMLIQVKSENYERGLKRLNCILSSYSLRN